MDNRSMRYFESPYDTALGAALKAWRRESTRAGALALVAEADAQAVPHLQQCFGEEGVALAGAVFPELIVGSGFRERGVLLLPCDPMPAHRIFACDPGSEDSADATAAPLAKFAAGSATAGKDSLFLIFDAMVPNVASILEGLYLRLADRVHYTGVCAGSETFRPMPCLFDRERFTQGDVLALLLPEHAGGVLEHGYRLPDEMIAATSTQGNRIVSIDWRPAFTVYREQAKSLFGVEITRDNFYRNAVRLPFGILRAEGDVLVRIPVALEDDGSIFCVGEIPEHSVLTLLQAEEKKSLHTAERLAQELADHDDAVLTFYCAGRRMHKGEQAAAEIRALGEQRGGAPVAGALSLGEIGSSRHGGYPLFHNAALVCIPWMAP